MTYEEAKSVLAQTWLWDEYTHAHALAVVQQHNEWAKQDQDNAPPPQDRVIAAAQEKP